ncbi:MAG: Jag N-terminal domain-containing protein [Firmicutes bacterium]|nr:Jag N-terminal domain-containing protein [Bacillota bacterium]
MQVVEKVGRTVEEAVAGALAELGASRDEVEVEVLEEGTKGLFGLLGAKQARVRVRRKAGVAGEPPVMDEEAGSGGARAAEGELGEEREGPGAAREDAQLRPWPPEEKVAAARTFLTGVLVRMGVDAALESRVDEDGFVHVNIVGEDLGLVIGRRGQTLDALQFLVNQVANRGSGERVRIVLDAEGYRERRAEALRALARRMAARARRQGRRVVLEPMSAMERRIVHLALANEPGVETHSEGEDPNRRVVIVPRG